MVRLVTPNVADVEEFDESQIGTGNYDQLLEHFLATKQLSELSDMDGSDVLSIACMADATLVKDLELNHFDQCGRFLGANSILKVLQNDKFELPLTTGVVPKSKHFSVNRWACI